MEFEGFVEVQVMLDCDAQGKKTGLLHTQIPRRLCSTVLRGYQKEVGRSVIFRLCLVTGTVPYPDLVKIVTFADT
jgi:hypothetical protein